MSPRNISKISRKQRAEAAARASCVSDEPSALSESLAFVERAEPEKARNERVRSLALSAGVWGSVRVLSWLLENRPDGLADALPKMPGWSEATVKWCVEEFGPPESRGAIDGAHGSAGRVGTPQWASMKADATEAKCDGVLGLLAGVVVPPCTRRGEGGCEAAFGGVRDMWYSCPACRIASALVPETPKPRKDYILP